MSKYVGRPAWFDENYERCCLLVIQEIDMSFCGAERPIQTVIKDFDKEIEEHLVEMLRNTDQVNLLSLHETQLFAMTGQAIIYFMPSIARLALNVDDFDSRAPAEDRVFLSAVYLKSQTHYESMKPVQQSACKCLLELLLYKEKEPHVLNCDILAWKTSPIEDLWIRFENCRAL